MTNNSMTAQRTLHDVKHLPLLTGVWVDGARYDGTQFVQPKHSDSAVHMVEASRFAVENPATGMVLAEVEDQGAAEAEKAVQALSQAQADWAALHPFRRTKLLYRWYELIVQHEQDLALILTLEQGKPLAEALAEVRYGASFVQWYAEEAKRIQGQWLQGAAREQRAVVMRQPIGVCASITPWNFPNAMITRKVAPALAAGCTVVLKPAELTPLSAIAVTQLAYEAGIPHDVFRLVVGSDASAIGQVFCASPMVRHLSFTGSTEVGRILMRQCASTVKKLALELGGNAPFIVFDDADLDAAVQGLLKCKFRNAGQVCIAANRVLVQQSVLESFVGKLKDAVAGLNVANGVDDGTDMGPLIEASAVQKVQHLVRDALDKGASEHSVAAVDASQGYFCPPTILTNVTADMACAQEEIFGPVIAISGFDTEEEAIAHANDTVYGLASYFYACDMQRILRVSEALEYGMVGVNTGALSASHLPFGGVKQSGFGREGGVMGLEEYLAVKYVHLTP